MPALQEAVYLLTGQGDDSKWPVARFQPQWRRFWTIARPLFACIRTSMVLPSACTVARRWTSTAELRALAVEANCLPVPFAIPPMLARWDRALYELRVGWTRKSWASFLFRLLPKRLVGVAGVHDPSSSRRKNKKTGATPPSGGARFPEESWACFSFLGNGWGGRTRTFNFLVNSQASCRLDHTPSVFLNLSPWHSPRCSKNSSTQRAVSFSEKVCGAAPVPDGWSVS